MRKVVIHKAGGYDRLRIEEGPEPTPGRGEVLIKTEAIGVNYADCIVRMGLYESAKTYVGWPITPGFEFAGRVEAVGEGVDDISSGDAMFGVTRFGGYATHIAVSQDQLFALPGNLSMSEAAAFPSVFLTAYYALFHLANVRAGMMILVHSAAGGVGGALVQLAKAQGCCVVGVVGKTSKVDTAQKLGADAVIDKEREKLWPAAERHAPGGYDVILDANGVSTLSGSYRHLAAPGRLVVYGFHSMIPRSAGKPNYPKLALDYLRTPRFNPIQLTNENKSILAFNLSYLFERNEILREGMQELLGWLEEKKIVAPPTTTFVLDDVASAHRAIESGTTVGKLVLLP